MKEQRDYFALSFNCSSQSKRSTTPLGTGGDHDDSNTCGNDARFGGDNGDQRIKAMGYILVQ